MAKFALIFRRTCGFAVLAFVSAISAHAQHPANNGVSVLAFEASEADLAPLAARLRDTVSVRLAADPRWRVIPHDLRERPRDPGTGRPMLVHQMVFGNVRRAGGDTLVATWMCADVETSQRMAADSVRLVSASGDSVVAALARTVVLNPRRRP